MKISKIPESHLDMVDGPYIAVLTTVLPNGQPQMSPLWCNRDGNHILINTMQNFRKYKNMRANPKVTLLIYNPQQPLRNIEIRGTVVEMTETKAEEHLDELTQLYLRNPHARFFGDCVASDLKATHIPVRIKIAPNRVRVEG